MCNSDLCMVKTRLNPGESLFETFLVDAGELEIFFLLKSVFVLARAVSDSRAKMELDALSYQTEITHR